MEFDIMRRCTSVRGEEFVWCGGVEFLAFSSTWYFTLALQYSYRASVWLGREELTALRVEWHHCVQRMVSHVVSDVITACCDAWFASAQLAEMKWRLANDVEDDMDRASTKRCKFYFDVTSHADVTEASGSRPSRCVLYWNMTLRSP